MKTGLSTTLGVGAGLTILADAASVRGAVANEKISMALIGCGGRGRALLHGFDYPNDSRMTGFQEFDDVNVLYCCDLRKEQGERAAGLANAQYVADMRTVLDDKGVDAVICALPDHWHALAAILACQAGKDVFTEKPAAHSAWEGQKMVEAARKYKRIVQHGTQCRSAPYCMDARKFIEDGKLGTIHLCRVFNQKREMKTFKINAEPKPEGLDWSAWLGPAADRPYSSTILYSNWHELWDFAEGDLGNDGVHQLDLARWLIGKDFPKAAHAAGGRYTDPDGDGETPDTLVATYEYDDMVMTAEQTLYTDYILKIDPVVRQTDMFPYWLQCATRIEIFGTKGLMMIGRHGGGWQVFVRPQNRQPVVSAFQHGRFPDVEHKRNFLDCIRSRELPNADIEEGYRSTLLVHYSTISHRLGGAKLEINQNDGTILNNPAAAQYWKREYRSPYVVPENV